ncbi:cytochrome P450 monooxygenase, partial [Fusarium albosuccineum]
MTLYTAIVALLALGAGILFFRLFHTAFISPLARVPCSHFSARFSSLWVSWLRHQNQLNRFLEAAHDKHGPVVRLGPNELSVNCVQDGFKTIYTTRAFEKHHFYNEFRNFILDDMTSAIEPQAHSIQRCRVGNTLSRSFLYTSKHLAAVVEGTVNNDMIPLLRGPVPGEAHMADISSIMRALAMDLWMAYVFGRRMSCRFLQNLSAADRFNDLMLMSRPTQMFYWPSEFPRLHRLLGSVGYSFIPRESVESSDELDAWLLCFLDATDEEIEAVELGVKAPFRHGEAPIMYRQFLFAIAREGLSADRILRKYTTMPTALVRPKSTHPDPSWKKVLRKPRSAQQIAAASEIMDQTLGVIHVFPTVLIFACWHLSRNEDIQKRLTQELRSASDFGVGEDPILPDLKALDQLHILHAVMMETLRLNGPNTGQELRVTPRGKHTRLGNYDIPGGVVVSSSPFCLHRTKEVFSDPDSWRPERWLPEPSPWDGNGEAEQWFWAFSSGARGCVGNMLAQFLIRQVLAAIYVKFTSEEAQKVDLRLIGDYVAEPNLDTVKLRFTSAVRLLLYWLERASQIMALDPNQNPLSFPILHHLSNSPSLLHAIQSIGAAHEQFFNPDNIAIALKERQQALRLLQRELDPHSGSCLVSSFLSVFLLGTFTSWVEGSLDSFGKEHVFGARAIINHLLANQQIYQGPYLTYAIGCYIYWDSCCAFVAEPGELPDTDTPEISEAINKMRSEFHPISAFGIGIFYLIGRVGRYCRSVLAGAERDLLLEAVLEERLLDWESVAGQESGVFIWEAYRKHALIMIYRTCSTSAVSGQLPAPSEKEAIIQAYALRVVQGLLSTPVTSQYLHLHAIPLLTAASELPSDEQNLTSPSQFLVQLPILFKDSAAGSQEPSNSSPSTSPPKMLVPIHRTVDDYDLSLNDDSAQISVSREAQPPNPASPEYSSSPLNTTPVSKPLRKGPYPIGPMAINSLPATYLVPNRPALWLTCLFILWVYIPLLLGRLLFLFPVLVAHKIFHEIAGRTSALELPVLPWFSINKLDDKRPVLKFYRPMSENDTEVSLDALDDVSAGINKSILSDQPHKWKKHPDSPSGRQYDRVLGHAHESEATVRDLDSLRQDVLEQAKVRTIKCYGQILNLANEVYNLLDNPIKLQNAIL